MTSNEDYLDSLLANLNNQTDEKNDAFFDEIKEKEDENLLDILNEDEATEDTSSEEVTEESFAEDIPLEETIEDTMPEEIPSEEAIEDLIPTEEEFEEAEADSEEESEEEYEEEAEEESKEIPTEEFIDMDDIDALLSDVSDIHPERTKSAEELEEQIARYEENPEAVEEALLNDADEEDSQEDEEESEEESSDENSETDDFLSNLEDVDALLADVENQAKEEEEKLAAERSETTDGDLDEINDILNKSDNNEAVSDDLLSMIEGLDNEGDEAEDGLFENEGSDEEEKKDKKEKKEKKKKNKKEKADSGKEKKEKGSEEKDKKGGLFSKLLGFMFEADEEEEEENKTEENKDKKDKKDKKKKGKGGAKANDNASIEAELDEEDAKDKKGKKKDKKEKKPKKEKAPKKEKKAKPEEPEEKQKSSIKKKGIILTGAFCATLLAVILFATIMGPKVLARNEARIAYYNRDYETASNKLYGMKLGESDRLIYEKASTLYRLELFYDKVEAYETLGDRTKMLDALLQTWEECKNLSVDARLLNITEEVDEFRVNTEEKIAKEYGITAEDIAEITEMKPVYYTIAVEKIAAGENYKEMSDETVVTETNEEEEKEELEDMLPEEMELLDNSETEE